MANYEDVYTAQARNGGTWREKDGLRKTCALWSGAIEPDILQAAFRCNSILDK
jgi:hypothetical protein